MTRKQMWLTRIVAFLAVLIVLNGCDQPKQKSKSVESLTQSTDYVFEPVVKGEKLAFPKILGLTLIILRNGGISQLTLRPMMAHKWRYSGRYFVWRLGMKRVKAGKLRRCIWHMR